MSFALHPQLEADTHRVSSLPLCEALLMNDARYPWLVLVPRRPGLTELLDLDQAAQAALLEELNAAMAWVREQPGITKVNVGALGNLVPQLHVHVLGRCPDDPAWPGPVWGHSPAQPYTQDAQRAVSASAQSALQTVRTS